ncbi:uncharacterized protein LOC131597734 [Vicia villosa]|uniref:uncharacterized protein LOC131597734 n=1 Tax=Vicia villosa TaxID=3911 RepID=UPI00273A7C08|nr:uncharacterized protein LOC131597734 [Vicia villosa]
MSEEGITFHSYFLQHYFWIILFSKTTTPVAAPTPRAKGTRKNAAGSRADIGWQHGTDVLGNGKKIKCKYCSKIISGGIFRFKRHLAGNRDDAGPCASVPDDVRYLFLKIVAESDELASKKRQLLDIERDVCVVENHEIEIATSQKKGKFIVGSSTGVQKTINQMVKKDLKEKVDEQVARFFYTSAIPFNCIKNEEFAKMCEMIGKYGIGYKPPSYHHIREPLLDKAVKDIDVMLEDYKKEWKKTGCSIMSDGWTDKKRRSICNFLVNSPKGTIFLYSLDTSDISKTTDKVFKMLDDVVNLVGEENVVQVVTDNAANYKAAGEMLMQTRKNLYWTPCAAHCIDLILEDFEKKLKVHQVTIKKGRKITTHIYGRTMLISMLKKHTKGRDLIRPGITRFATTYLTLSYLNDNKGALMSLFTSEDWNSSKFASTKEGKDVAFMALDSRFWGNTVTCLKTVSPLIEVLRLVDSEEKPSMGFLYAEMDSAKEKIKNNFNNVKKR